MGSGGTTTPSDAALNPLLTFVGSTASTAVSLTFFAVLAYRRDALMTTFFIGSILNGVLSKVLKVLLNQDRPDELNDVEHIKMKPSDKGMPSSHAMSLGFLGTFTALEWAHASVWVVPALVLYVAASLWYRIEAKLHTTDQVAVGIVAGATNGWLWHGLTHGTCPFLPPIRMMELVSSVLIQPLSISSGGDGTKLPVPSLIVPALVGAMVVGSFERRIGRWWSSLRTRSSSRDDDRKGE